MKTEQEYIKEFLYATLQKYTRYNENAAYNGDSSHIDLKPITDIIEMSKLSEWKHMPSSYKKAYNEFKQKCT